MEHVVIVGNGIAGITAARHIRKNSNKKITIISAESEHFFSRTALMYVYMGHMKFEHTQPYENQFWKKNRIELVHGYVTKINTAEKSLYLDGTPNIKYDKLIIATGSRPNIPPIPGIDSDGVLTSDKLLSWKKVPKNLLIIGGGPECSEFTSILNPLECKITIIEMLDRLLPSEDRDLGVKLASLFEKQNVKILTSSKVKMINRIDNVLQVHVQSPDGEVVVQPDNVLITSGIHADYFSKKKPVWESKKNQLLKYNIVPTYLSSKFIL
mgnify:CR=1 FL=1